MCPSVASLLPRGRSAETTAEKQYFGYKSVGHGPLRDFYGCLSTSIMAALSRVVYPGASATPVAQSCVPKVTFHESELSARHRSLWRAVGHYRCGLSVLMAVPVSRGESRVDSFHAGPPTIDSTHPESEEKDEPSPICVGESLTEKVDEKRWTSLFGDSLFGTSYFGSECFQMR